MSRIAITGSSGLIGTALRLALAAKGHDVVRAFRGNPSDPAALWDPATGWIREGAFAGCDAVVNLAGENVGEGRWTAARKKELMESRIGASRLLIDHLAGLDPRPKTFISASAVGFYGNRGDETLTEASSRGAGFLADLVEAWERETSRAAEFGMRTVQLRFGVVLTKEGGALKKMLLPFKMGAGGKIGSGKQYMPVVSKHDAVAAILFALENDAAAGAYNVTIPQPATNAEFTKALGKQIHRPTLVPIPGFGMKLLFGSGQAEEMLLASQRVRPQRLEEAGFVFAQPTVSDVMAAAFT